MGIELDDEFDLTARMPEPRYQPIPDGDVVPGPRRRRLHVYRWWYLGLMVVVGMLLAFGIAR